MDDYDTKKPVVSPRACVSPEVGQVRDSLLTGGSGGLRGQAHDRAVDSGAVRELYCAGGEEQDDLVDARAEESEVAVESAAEDCQRECVEPY